MQILLRDFNSKLGGEDIFKPTIGYESQHPDHNDNDIRIANFATSKHLVVTSTKFPHRNIHKYILSSPDWITENQNDHISIDRRWHPHIILTLT